MAKDLYFSKDLASLFNVSLPTAQRWCASGKVRASRIGKSWVVTDEAISEFLQKNEGRKKS